MFRKRSITSSMSTWNLFQHFFKSRHHFISTLMTPWLFRNRFLQIFTQVFQFCATHTILKTSWWQLMTPYTHTYIFIFCHLYVFVIRVIYDSSFIPSFRILLRSFITYCYLYIFLSIQYAHVYVCTLVY